MKNNLIKISLFLILFIGIVFCTNVQAVDIPKIEEVEYSDEYKEYMALSDEEKAERTEPSRYNVISPKTNSEYLSNLNNIFKSATLVKSGLDSEYDLRDIISQNVAIRNQMNTNSCWAFATIGALESNIALLDYKAGRTGNVYDYSERHLDYSVRSNAFNNDEVNKYGYNIGFEKGGTFLMAESYLSNGMGAIEEEEMPFENNEDNIDISEIQNKNTATTLYDTILFEDIDDIGKTELMSKMKQVISNYGGIYAIFNGANIFSDTYNNATGAIYCPNSTDYPSNHGGIIIGWDDTYSKSNFKEGNQPANDGAWIIKNSWGEKLSFDLNEVKEDLYTQYKEQCNQAGFNSADEITNEFLLPIIEASYGEGKVTIEGDSIVITVGDNGYMYISYDDANIYSELYAIEKATSTKDYDNIYQNDLLHPGLAIGMQTTEDMYIANKFKRDSSEDEVLTMVSIFTMQEVTAKVFVNPNSDDLSKLQQVELKDGESIKLEPGYHTIILAEPVKLTGDSFAVAMSVQSGTDKQTVMVESKKVDENAEVNSNESFFSTKEAMEAGVWIDFCSADAGNQNCNVSIKAFTEKQTSEEPAELQSIEISNPPTNTEYTEGEKFDTSGMKVTATYSDLTTKEVTNYKVLDGDNLYYGQNSVTISYTENGITKEAKQNITVKQVEQQKEIKSIEMASLPDKTTYKQNEKLNLDGGKVKVIYADDTSTELNLNSSSLTITGFDNQTIGKQTITVEYQGFTTTFELEVEEGAKPVLSDFTNANLVVKDATVYLYKEIIDDDYIDINIEVDNISGRDENTEYTYYYYLSENKSDENIENWTKVKNAKVNANGDGTYTLTGKISTKDIAKIEELSDANNLYLYIKEVGTVGENSVEQTYTEKLKVDGDDATYYMDNEYQGKVEDIIDNNKPTTPDGDNDNNNNDDEDTTISPKPIPQTGEIYLGIIAIAIIAGIGIYFFVKNKNIDK